MLGRALALQFHPEVDGELLEGWLAGDRDGEVVGFGRSHDELRSHNNGTRRQRGEFECANWCAVS